MEESIPVINFTDQDRFQRAKKLAKAMEEVGFVYLDNVPGYDEQVEDRLLEASKWFFGLPLEEKLKLSPKKWNSSAKNIYRGYVPVDLERDMLREQYGTNETLPDDHPDRVSGNPFYEATPYPEGEDGVKFRELLESSRKVFHEAAMEVMHLIAMGLDMNEDAFDYIFLPKSTSSFRLMHYPTYEKEAGNLDTLTCEEHVDSVFVTLLVTFGFWGLEIEMSDGSWIKVPPRPGSLVVNIGRLLSRITKGRFKATKHRVRDIGAERYSLPYFLEPSTGARIVMPDDPSPLVYGKWYTQRVKTKFNYQFGHLPDDFNY